jgi:aryl-alcohol dehydrogenase-like predicted oxidoreductase
MTTQPPTVSPDAANAGRFTIGGDTPVNRLGFGAMRLTGPGIWGMPADRDAALAVLRRVRELGIDLIDTADSYGPDVSEELIAAALFPYPGDLVIATKGGWKRAGPDIWYHNATPDHLRKAVDGSLRRLRRDQIDLYQLHIPDPAVAFEESLVALAEMRQQGKIRHIGLSNVTAEHVERALRVVPIVSVQNRYSIADRESDHVVDLCAQLGIAFLPWGPLGHGERLQSATFTRIAAAHGATRAQLSIAWLLHRSPNVIPIPGTASLEHLAENVAAAAIRLTDAEFAELAR